MTTEIKLPQTKIELPKLGASTRLPTISSAINTAPLTKTTKYEQKLHHRSNSPNSNKIPRARGRPVRAVRDDMPSINCDGRDNTMRKVLSKTRVG